MRALPNQSDSNISLPGSTAPNVHVIERPSPDITVITPEKPDSNALQPNGTTPGATVTEQPAPDITVITPEKPDSNTPQPNGTTPGATVAAPKEPDVRAIQPDTAAPTVTVTDPQKAPRSVQLWELLPLTPVKREKPEEDKAITTPAVPAKEPEPKKNAAQKPTKPAATSIAKQETPPRTLQPAPVKPEQKAAPRTEPARKAKLGEQLRIPPEAVQTGRLDFLEGCWQGTRPEYFSKRIVQECFCFGPQGSYGRRTVLDPSGRSGGRACTGTTRARMEGSTLRVSSSGAYCSDGERWGAAQMTCRGSGQSTPCSWIFTDANGGRQSYEIPFVRVESCGRRR